MQMAENHLKRCSIPLITRETQIDSVMSYHLTMIVRMAIIKNLQTINAGEGVEKMEPSCAVDGNVNGYNHYGGQYESALKN